MTASSSFNEAPAKRGGKLDDDRTVAWERYASMRPPQNAGENALGLAIDEVFNGASMRPPQNAGENFADAAELRRRYEALQ